MKKAVLLILLSSTLIFGQNNKGDSIGSPIKYFVGTWRWVSSRGGLGGWFLTPKTQHIEQTLIIRKNQTESLYQNDSLVYTHHFKIYRKAWGQDSVTLMHITDNDSLYPSDSTSYLALPDRSIFVWHADTLYINDIFLSDGMSDCYIRMKR